MTYINEIGIEHIKSLNDLQLTKLLHNLLSAELSKNGIEGGVFVPYNIKSKDAGEDGRIKIKWQKQKQDTKWIKSKFCLFQNKAFDLQPAECYKEILENNNNPTLKKPIQELVNNNGYYYLFTTKAYTKSTKQNRIDQFKKAFSDAGHPNFSNIEIYDANSIKDWVNENMTSITLTQGFNEITRPHGFKIWMEWEKIFCQNDTPSFQTTDTINSYLDYIHESLQKQRFIRIIGHSGLGKTRLALEAFRNTPEYPQRKLLQQQVVYFKLNEDVSIKEINTYMLSHQNQDGILIVDDCDENAHGILKRLVSSGMVKFKLITLDAIDSTTEEIRIILDKNNQQPVVRKIIDQQLGVTHSRGEKEYLARICEGYPWMAVKFCEEISKKGSSEFTALLPLNFIKKLLFGQSHENELEFDVIRACSVFSSFGFWDKNLGSVLNEQEQKFLKNQMNYIRTKICNENITEQKFYEICQTYKRKDIIEYRGRLHMVKPTILAITLAADWLKNSQPSRLQEVLTELSQHPLSQRLVEQLSNLDQIDDAKQLVASLWGIDSPFGSAEVLNTQWGSLLFRYIVHVNPKATAKTLSKVFGRLSKNEALQVKEARRNLVWALEKLCFRKDTFETATKILYLFAVSENESYANNATNQFLHLFQLYLSGTEASLLDRLKIIEFGIQQNDNDYVTLAIEALGCGFKTDHFHRMGGAEQQGSSAPLNDYRPTGDEVHKYWEKVWIILTDIACSESSNNVLAREQMAKAFRPLIASERIDLVTSAIQKIKKSPNTIWLEGVNALKTTLGFEKHLDEKIRQEVEKLIIEITPNSIKDQLKLKVSQPNWNIYEKGEDGHFIDAPKLEVEKFAKELVAKKVDWLIYLPTLLQGEQRQAFNFGAKLGQLEVDKERLIKKSFDALKSIKKDDVNISFIGGVLYGANDTALKTKAIDIVLQNKDYNYQAFYLTRLINPTLAEIERLFPIVDNGSVPIFYFQHFMYGGALNNFTYEEVITLCKKIITYAGGGWVALSLTFMYNMNHPTHRLMLQPLMEDIITSKNLLISRVKLKFKVEAYHWYHSVLKLLDGTNNTNLAQSVIEQIIEACAQDHLMHNNHLERVLEVLIMQYPLTVWTPISKAIIDDYLIFQSLNFILGHHNGDWEHRGTLFKNDALYPIMLDWMKSNPEIAPMRIAYMMPIQKSGTNTAQWHPFAKSVIDIFGQQHNVLQNISSNMSNYSWTGSTIPYHETQKELFNFLVNHSLSNVREWAEDRIHSIDKRIEREKLDDEEWNIQ